jgi:hypothetical protein
MPLHIHRGYVLDVLASSCRRQRRLAPGTHRLLCELALPLTVLLLQPAGPRADGAERACSPRRALTLTRCDPPR